MSFSSNLLQPLSWVTFITHLFSHWVVIVSCYVIVRPIDIQNARNLQWYASACAFSCIFSAGGQRDRQIKIPPSSNCEKNNVVINIH